MTALHVLQCVLLLTVLAVGLPVAVLLLRSEVEAVLADMRLSDSEAGR